MSVVIVLASAAGYMSHLKGLLASWLKDMEDVCIAVPCDSTEAWVIAAYDETDHAEEVEDPWKNVISRGKCYHGIRIHGHKKSLRIFEQFASDVRNKWTTVTELCQSAKDFEHSLLALIDQPGAVKSSGRNNKICTEKNDTIFCSDDRNIISFF